MANSLSNHFLMDPDQATRRAELLAFIGPNPAKFLKAYDAQAAIANRPPGQRAKINFFPGTFLWPAFFIGPVWFFYRKMWLWGGIITAIIIAVGLSPLGNRIGLPVGVAMAGTGAAAYIHHAIKRIEQLRATSPTGTVDPQQLAQIGGVSKTAGWIGGILYALLTLFAIAGIILAAHDGQPLPR